MGMSGDCLRFCLKSCGSHIRSAPGGAYSLAIMDMGLPDIREPEFSHRLKAMVESVEQAIALTRMGRNDDLDCADQLGIAQSMTKPVKQSTLREMLQHTFGHPLKTGSHHRAGKTTLLLFQTPGFFWWKTIPSTLKSVRRCSVWQACQWRRHEMVWKPLKKSRKESMRLC